MHNPQNHPLRVMTFNIRNTTAPDGANHWIHRKELWASTVRNFNPDLLGIQEVWADQHDQLQQMFPDYASVGVAREDGLRKGEWALILYRRDRFDLIQSGNFWLSETPDIVGSRSWNSAYVRICTWVKLRDRQTNRILIHANTHLDNESAEARLQSAKLLRSRLHQLSEDAEDAEDAALILTGDFNSTELDEPYHHLTTDLKDSFRQVHPHRSPDEASYHGFTDSTAGARIDWILHTPHLIPTSAQILRSPSPAGLWPSDHHPVTAEFQWAPDLSE